MAPGALKRDFGGRLAFHGGISVAEPLASGTVADVKRYCRETLDTPMPGGGFCFAPANTIMHGTPVENVLAMYETAQVYGMYAKR